jgi:hypothetical protein
VVFADGTLDCSVSDVIPSEQNVSSVIPSEQNVSNVIPSERSETRNL